jgi:transposase-like protein
MVIGAFVRGLSMRDIESLCEKAGLGKLSKSTAQRICTELRERFEQFKRRDLYDVQVAALFLDAVFLSVRPNGPKEGVLVAWRFTEQSERVLLSVMLGMRESHEDWLALGRDLIARGLGAPLLVVADGAPGLTRAVEQCWPASDRQHCAVHRVRNLLAKLPERERERVRLAYWQALDDATSERDGKQRLKAHRGPGPRRIYSSKETPPLGFVRRSQPGRKQKPSSRSATCLNAAGAPVTRLARARPGARRARRRARVRPRRPSAAPRRRTRYWSRPSSTARYQGR